MEGRRLMPPTPCLERHCPNAAVSRGRCEVHKERYGVEHQAARRDLAMTLPALCAYGCGKMLRHGEPWVAAHVIDGDSSAGRVASCPRCNQRLGKRGVYPALALREGRAGRISGSAAFAVDGSPARARLSVDGFFGRAGKRAARELP